MHKLPISLRTVLVFAAAWAMLGAPGAWLLPEWRTLVAADPPVQARQPLVLQLRTRVATGPGSGRYHAITKEVEWDPAQTAIVICDMWDHHWCQGAQARVAEMAPRMNEVVAAARGRGVLIIHCPSSCMKPYEGTPMRKLAQQAPAVQTKVPLQPWCRLNPEREGSLPIDDRDGGCDCQPKCPTGNPWTRQIAAIDILEGDAVTDSAEAYYLMKQRGITNVIVMGVHTNMCVLGRPFSIRQLVYQGLNVVLMRDLTDTMYNSRSAPYVSHFTGTDLVVEHIERHWCPTITSTQFIGGKEFRFKDDRRPHLAIIVAEDEYKTEETLPVLALQHLGRDFRVSFVFGSEQDRNDLPGLEVLESADLALFSVRRRVLPQKQLEAIRKFVSAGRGVLGIRTASHAFSLRSGQDVPPGFAAWPTFDPEVLGGNYQGHHGQGPKTAITLAAGASEHEILRGVELSGFEGHGSLYKNAPLVEDALPLLMGSIPDKPPEPIAWTFIRQDGGRSFYTSLGHKDDFEEPAFQKMLYQAACWVVGRKPTSP